MSSQTETTPWRLEWTEELSVFIPEIDAEHRRFIQLVNELNESIVHHADIDEVIMRMQSIVTDALEHFRHEEVLFYNWNYPDAEQHARKHAGIMNALHDIMRGIKNCGTDYERIAAGLKVKQALIQHLLTEDMKYRDYHQNNKLKND